MRTVILGAMLAFAATASVGSAGSADSAKPRHVPGALVVVIDRSLTMHGDALAAMKAAALAAAAALAPGDQIAIVAFDSEVEVVAPLGRPADRARLAKALGRLEPEGGTNVYAGLKAAHELLRASSLATKHAIIMSDGDAPEDGLADLVAEMHRHGETLSIIGLPSAPPLTATCCRAAGHADRTLMAMLAKGDGRLYFVDDLPALAKTVAAEVRLALE